MKPGPAASRVFQSDSFGRYYAAGWLVVAVLMIGLLLMPRQRPAGADDSYWAGYVTGYVLGLLAMSGGAAWLIIRASHYKLTLNEVGIEIQAGFGKPKRLAWAELKRWEFSMQRSLKLHKEDGGKLVVPAFFNETQSLLDELQRYLPNPEWSALPQGQSVQLKGSKAGQLALWGVGALLIFVFGLGAWQASWALIFAMTLILGPLFAWLFVLHARHLVGLEFSARGLKLDYPFRQEIHPPEFLLGARFLGADLQPLPVARLADGRKLPLRQLKPGALSSVGLLNRVVESLPAPSGLDWAQGLQAFEQNLQQARRRRNRLMNQNELDPPPWMSDPGSHPMGGFYRVHVDLLLRGQLAWGLALDPNPILRQEGKADAPMRFAFQREGEACRDPRWLQAEAAKAERRAGELAQGFQVAQALGHRHEWPVDTLRSPWFPILILEEAPEWCRILPHRYWPAEWQQAWIKASLLK